MKAAHEKTFVFGAFRLDVANWQLTRDDQSIPLEPRVLSLLVLLVNRRGELVEKSELSAQLWPDTHVEERTLTQHVYVLRRALGPLGYQYIQNVRKKGYRFVAEVTVIGSALPESTPPFVSATSPPPPPVTPPSARFSWQLAWVGTVPMAALVVWTMDLGAPDGTQALTAELQRVTHHGAAQLSAIAPDAKRIAYVRSGASGESLRLIESDGSAELELTAADGDRYQGLTFSPNGEWLYYIRDFRLYRRRLAGSITEPLIHGVDRPISFAPDGNHFAYIHDDVARGESSIHVAAADGTNPRVLTVRKKPMVYRALAWSPKGDVVAASGGYEGHGEMAVVMIDAASGREQPFGNVWPHVGEIGWSADGSSLAAVIRPEPAVYRQIVQMTYPSGAEAPLTSDLEDYRGLSVSSQGMLTSVQAGQQSNLWLISADAPPRALTSETGDHQYPAWVSDNAVVYQHRTGGRGQIHRMELSTGVSRPLTPDHCDSTAPVATGDGQWVVFVSACTGPAMLWRMRADGRELRQLTSGGGDNHPSISAGGEWVYYESLEDGKPIVKRVPFAGGKPENVTTRLSRLPVASPTGDLLACYYWDEHTESPATIAVVSAASGTLVGSLPTANPARRWPFMRWSPDGRFLVTIGREGDPQNLWGHAIDGTAPRAFTAFADALDTHSFAWSREHSRLIVARGRARGDVVLIRSR